MYYTLEKTAEILDCTPGDVNRLREANKLRAFRDGASWKFRKEDVEKYLTDLIRERSTPAPDASDLLNDSDDEELPTMLADSSSFDAMIDATAETLEIKTNAAPEPDFVLDDVSGDDDLQIVAEPQAEDDGLALEIESDDLQLVDEAPQAEAASEPADFAPEVADDADFGLALDSEDDDLLLVDEAPQAETAPEPAAFAPEADVADDDLLLVADDEPKADDESASVFSLDDDADALAGASDDDLLHLGSDSGLSLLDDVDLSGSNVSLDGGDVVLGGSGSGSGSGLHLGSDSGLSLLGDDAEDFALEGVEVQNDAAFAPETDDDDSIFELADEPKPSAVLELEQNANSDTATILGTGAEDFQLASDESSTYDVAESESVSQSIEIASEDDPFFTKDEDSGAFDPFAAPADDADANPFANFGAATDDANPFANAVETPAGDGFDGFGGNDGAFGGGSFDAQPADPGFGAASDAEVAPVAARAPQTEYTGKDFIFLVPCFLFVLLATIGAYELCRTIWSYEECSFDITGPVLDIVANAIGLTK